MTDFPIYSPEEELADARLQAKGLRLFVKRDDMIHPFISGNKWRKLKYQLENARLKGQDHLVSFGGAYSNHLLALAAAAAKYGFKSTGFVRGEEVQPQNNTLFLCREFGMELIFTSREIYREKKTELFREYFHGNPSACFIDEGGRSPLAIKGCAELIGELTRPYDHIFAACGTGSTLAGIVRGIAAGKMTAWAEGIAVLKNASFLENDIRDAANTGHPFRLHLDFHQGGYAKAPRPFISWLQDFHRRHGLLLDPVYTGKMMYAIFRLAEENYFKAGSTLLALHTGGLFGLLGMKEKWGGPAGENPAGN
ncbi:1-aminocyclopropane-1-carboxylate deaminase [Anseongella ginsenosidimutans]|uniref:1-aminocyclopropane-1-carboxylate deaminase n=1 Tax=Anseongella ginsenosidimutans TaxID=496056 RepID=A0A4R3KNK4_9SPHI|nr:pyridoxal-phosphate dependent enzyme [Anseongella ginsenosidimutans]QEC53667.1 pyridoxal-phosphate dependent enzyme [Anseongella ginsenosidimutans]TCS86083.1 1-aminocyclopropane-1-carboxylate deaminase [Anseongella ginsenosidimutans]